LLCDCKLTASFSLAVCWNSTENPPLICTRNETINENKFIYFIRFLPITRTTEAIIVWYSPQKFQIIKID